MVSFVFIFSILLFLHVLPSIKRLFLLKFIFNIGVCLVRVKHLGKGFLNLVSATIVRQQLIDSTYTVIDARTCHLVFLVEGSQYRFLISLQGPTLLRS